MPVSEINLDFHRWMSTDNVKLKNQELLIATYAYIKKYGNNY